MDWIKDWIKDQIKDWIKDSNETSYRDSQPREHSLTFVRGSIPE